MQGLRFDPRIRNKYEKDLRVEYMLWPMFAEYCGFPPTQFLHIQQHLTDYRYPGNPIPPAQHWYTFYKRDENGALIENTVLETFSVQYCSFFFALRDVEAALEAELELFCERTLPAMNAISDPASYAEKDMDIRRREIPYEYCLGLSPAGIDILLAQQEWGLAEKSLRKCMRTEEHAGMTTSGRKWLYDWYCSALEHVLARDETWIQEHFHQNIANNWKTLERWNPRLYKAYAETKRR